MIPVMPRIIVECVMPVEELNAREKRREKDEREKATVTKAKTKTIMEEKRQALRETQRRLPILPSRLVRDF